MPEPTFITPNQKTILLRQGVRTLPDGGAGLEQTPVAVLDLTASEVTTLLDHLNASFAEVVFEDEGRERRHSAFVTTPLPLVGAQDVSLQRATVARYSVTATWPECLVKYEVVKNDIEQMPCLLPKLWTTASFQQEQWTYSCHAIHEDAEVAQLLAQTGKALNISRHFPAPLVSAARDAYQHKKAVQLGEATVFVTPEGIVMLMTPKLSPTAAYHLQACDGGWNIRGVLLQF